MIEKIKDKAWEKIESQLKDFIVTMVEVAKSAAPEVAKNAINVEGSVDLPGVAVLLKSTLASRLI